MIQPINERNNKPKEGITSTSVRDSIIFRPLRAEEVVVRVAEAKDGHKASLLLYQDARCAMNILDSTLGSTSWQREYYEAAGMLFCKIGIFDSETNQWLWKSDTGAKSNIEEEKGLASDAFKRAAVAWGIGRELYTAPRISVELNEKDFYNERVCQSFRVGEMEVIEGVITKLTILDKWGKLRYSYPNPASIESPQVSSSFSSSSTSVAPAHEIVDVASKYEDALRVFCEGKKASTTGEERNEVDKFYKYYMRPDKTDSSKTRIGTWNSYPDYDLLWVRWLANANKYK